MENVSTLVCTICGAEYKPNEVEYICTHTHPNPGNLTVEYDMEKVKAQIASDEASNTTWPTWTGMWRYRAFLPLPLRDSASPSTICPEVASLSVGNTPLVPSAELAAELRLKEVWVKDDGRNPSASLKDRASALVALKAKLEKRPIVATASTGNAAAALSCVCAGLKQPCIIFVPAAAPEAKRTQLVVYGAQVVLVEGTYDDAFELCQRACQRFGWYCRSTGYNPYTVEGKKTVSFEFCEQLYRRHHWAEGVSESKLVFEAPDYVAVSVGDGNIVSGVHKGLTDLYKAGLIDKMPKIIGVQADGSASIANAYKNKFDFTKEPLPEIDAQTVADSISAGTPRDPLRAVKAASETGGAYVCVSDQEILEAIPLIARKTGVFAEPAGATTLAGVMKAKKEGLIEDGKTLVIVNTGNGLKDIVSAKKSVEGQVDLVRKVKKGDLETLEKIFG